MSNQHTPGPWEVEVRDGSESFLVDTLYFVVNAKNKRIICDVYMYNNVDGEEMMEANANLIAAAPTMKAALEFAFKAFYSTAEINLNKVKALAIMKAALDKAKGGSQ